MFVAKNIITSCLVLGLVFSGCKSMNNKKKGAAIGAGAGAAVGAGIGKLANDNTLVGAIIGAAVGGVAGGVIGHYMDKQAAEIQRDVEGAKVERIGEGIKITFDSGILFDVNSSALKPAAQENIKNLSKVLSKYDDTNILIEGHTDNTGGDDLNQALSERRAASVANYVKGMGIKNSRITTVGYGETQPLESNDSAYGKEKNRRVEVAIMANKKLKRMAEKGKLESKEENKENSSAKDNLGTN